MAPVRVAVTFREGTSATEGVRWVPTDPDLTQAPAAATRRPAIFLAVVVPLPPAAMATRPPGLSEEGPCFLKSRDNWGEGGGCLLKVVSAHAGVAQSA